MASAFLDADQLRAATFVRHVELHDMLGSTNDRAAELAREATIPLPALVAACCQTAGRGRGQNKWQSAEGALTFSLLVEPAALGIDVAAWPQLSLATAVAVCDAIAVQLNITPTADTAESHSLGPIPSPSLPGSLGIKWPNDVYIRSRKVGGILIESPGGAAPAKNRLIVGIGLNVNNSWGNASADDAPRAIALSDVARRELDLQATLAAVLNAVAFRFTQLVADHPPLVAQWRRLNLLAGQNIVLTADECRWKGKCLALNDDAALVVESSRGIELFHSGSVALANEAH